MTTSRVLTALAAVVLTVSGCASGVTTIETGSPAAPGDAEVVNWRTLGCEEPAPLVVESSAALETDAGLAAESVAEDIGVPIEEAMRRLRLQEVLGERRSRHVVKVGPIWGQVAQARASLVSRLRLNAP